MAEQVEVIIGADSSKLAAELQLAQNNLRKFEVALRKATDPKQIEYLQRSISGLKEKINTLNSSQGSLASSSNKAGMALNDLSRIAQDAPYGFIGISNNINPLIESFSRLRIATGSTGGALKALGAGLTGPAGIGLAFGLVSAAISFASVGLSRWVKTTEEAKKQQKDFVDILNSTRSSALSSGLQLQAYIDVAKNGQLPLEQRNEALKKANEILGEHGTKLTLANVATKAITEQTKLYTEALIAQAVSTKFADQIADLTIKKIDLQKELATAQKEAILTTSDLNNVTSKNNKQIRDGLIVTSESNNLSGKDVLLKGKIVQATTKQVNVQKELNDINIKLFGLQSNLNQSIEDATKIFGRLGYSSKKASESVGESIDEILAKFRLKITADEAFGLPKLEEVRAKISDYQAVIEKLIVEKKVKLTFPKLIELQKELAGLRELEKQLEEQAKPVKLIKVEPIGPQIDKEYTKLNEFLIKFRKGLTAEEFQLLPPEQVIKNQINIFRSTIERLIKDFNISENSDLIQSLQGELSALLGKSFSGSKILDATKILQDELQTGAYEAGVSFAEALAQGMASGDISSFFEGINGIIADGMIRIGKQFIKFAAELITIQKTLISNPTTALIAGIALVAIGTAMKNQMAKQKAFATGTSFAPGGMALVGERGPELVSLPQGSKVIPNGKTNSMMQGALQAVEVYGTLRGQDIYFSNKKYGLTYNRQT